MDCSTPGFSVLLYLPEFALTDVRWASHMNHFIFCCPLLLLPSIFSSIRIFTKVLALLSGWTKYWIFSFSISPSNEYSGLISFKIHWLISLLSKGLSGVFSSTTVWASVLWCSAFFIDQLSYQYMISTVNRKPVQNDEYKMPRLLPGHWKRPVK